MSLLFVDGFDHYATEDLSKKYQSISTTGVSIVPNGGRRGGGCFRISEFNSSVGRAITSSTQVIVGAAISRNTFSSSGFGIFKLTSNGASAATLQYNNGYFYILNANASIVGTSSVVNTTGIGIWNYVEWKMLIADSIPANSCIVKVNGVEVLNLPAGTDTKFTTTSPTSFDMVRIGGSGIAPYSLTMEVDDLYICNTATAVMSNFLGDIRIDTVLPDADGTYNDGIPSTGTARWSILDNVPATTSSYVTLNNTGEKETVQFANLATITTQTIHAVQLNYNSLKTDAGQKSVAAVALSNSILQEATSSTLATSYVYQSGTFLTDPATGAAWSESAVNSAEFGIIVK